MRQLKTNGWARPEKQKWKKDSRLPSIVNRLERDGFIDKLCDRR
jgi:hypothetical protein